MQIAPIGTLFPGAAAASRAQGVFVQCYVVRREPVGAHTDPGNTAA
jgi:hypothetical protein